MQAKGSAGSHGLSLLSLGERSGSTEVGQSEVELWQHEDQHVGRFDVAVENFEAVQVGQPCTRVLSQLAGWSRLDGALRQPRQEVVQSAGTNLRHVPPVESFESPDCQHVAVRVLLQRG